METSLQVYRKWCTDPAVLPSLRGLFDFAPGDDRATGYIYDEDGADWPMPMSETGRALMMGLESLLHTRFTIVAYQAYRNGSGCDWHADTPFDAQAVLSLGVTRIFGIRPNDGGSPIYTSVGHGDLVYMPSGFQREWQHCVPLEDTLGERCSLVFRTVAKGRIE